MTSMGNDMRLRRYYDALIERMIEAWHDGAGEGLELTEFLGVSVEDYGKWIADSSYIMSIEPLPEPG